MKALQIITLKIMNQNYKARKEKNKAIIRKELQGPTITLSADMLEIYFTSTKSRQKSTLTDLSYRKKSTEDSVVLKAEFLQHTITVTTIY